MASTRTGKNFTIAARIDDKGFDTGTKHLDENFAKLHVENRELHPKLNYTTFR